MQKDLNIALDTNKRKFGFKKGCSTEAALHKVTNMIERRIAKKGYVLGVFLDIEAAFDNMSFKANKKRMPPRRNLITILVDDLLTLSPNDTPGYLQLQAFADDIVSLAEGNDLDVIWDRTCKTINTITKWCKTKVLTISALETKIVMFTWNKKWTLRPIVVDNTTIKLSTSAKFLGVTIDNKLNYNEHITNITKKATASLMHHAMQESSRAHFGT
ncbi:hypothetical protein ACHWQZ_G009327 [Mnemiopsis leidyi]